MKNESRYSRRNFIGAIGTATAASVVLPAFSAFRSPKAKKRLALVGTGIRGLGMWTSDLVRTYGDQVEFVGLCDINPGRLAYAKKASGLTCATFTDFELMMRETKPDLLIVTTVDSTHDAFIIRGMELGADIITEKPLTTDEQKCEAILQAEKRTGKQVLVTFNYRYSPHRAKMYELLHSGEIGELTSVDFHWYLDTSHGADYFRRWHRLKEKGGTLWVHKATHHFDLLNWWIASDPTEVYATGALDFYGKNNPFRHSHCRPCPHKNSCSFYWDMPKNQFMMDLYANNEQHDGYLRDGCVWKEDIDIYDKMAATIQYANGVQVSYSLTTYSPYEGYRIAFNGTKGRIDAWIEESNPVEKRDFDRIFLFKNFGKRQTIDIPHGTSGHGGGDRLMKDSIFGVNIDDPLHQRASVRDGALSILVGIAARKSCESGLPVKIGDLTSIVPGVKRQIVEG
jgi:predicted dehydrogenase